MESRLRKSEDGDDHRLCDRSASNAMLAQNPTYHCVHGEASTKPARGQSWLSQLGSQRRCITLASQQSAVFRSTST